MINIWKVSRNNSRLNYFDHLAVRLAKVTTRNQLIQCIWIYDQPINAQALASFHDFFSRSIANRLIEMSPLPFGRPRWVYSCTQKPRLRFSEEQLPRTQLLSWADEQANQLIDAFKGPAWMITTQAFSDGCYAISLVSSHLIGDGVGGMLAIQGASRRQIHAPVYAIASKRPHWIAFLSDGIQAVSDLPATFRALRRASSLIRKARKRDKNTRYLNAVRGRPEDLHEIVSIPRISIVVELSQWKHQARQRNGNSSSMLAGFAASLAAECGRLRPSDGKASLLLPINRRKSLVDDRAQGFAFTKAVIDPLSVSIDLSRVRESLKAAYANDDGHEIFLQQLLPLVPWLTDGAIRTAADQLFDYSEDRPVSCSNLGEIDPSVAEIAGSLASAVLMRGVDTHVSLADMKRTHGHLVVVASRLMGNITLCIESYQISGDNSTVALASRVANVLDLLGLEAKIET